MSRRSKAFDLKDPVVAIAAVTDDTPDEIRAALQRAVEAGWDFEMIWTFIGGIGAHDSLADAIDAEITGSL